MHSLGALNELHLAAVLDNDDPESRGRLRVRLHSTGMELWAACLTASAGSGYGVSCLPRAGEQVVLGFLSPEQPVVLGALWSGASSTPPDAAPVEERYLLRTPGGNQLLMDDANGGRVRIETPSGYHLTIDNGGSGTVTVEKGGEKVEMTASGVSVTTAGQVKVEAAQVSVSAAMVTVDAPMSQFSGVVKCDTLISNSVVSASYTPGAGNIW